MLPTVKVRKQLDTMTKTLLLAVLAAACGGGSAKPAPTTPPPTDPAPMKDPAATGPATPADPAAPAEPAVPPAPDPAKVKAELVAAETAAFEKAKPVFERYCASCHAKGGKNATEKK